MLLTICPGKDGHVKDLVIKSKGKACYFPGFQPEVGAEAHGWAGFCTGRKG